MKSENWIAPKLQGKGNLCGFRSYGRLRVHFSNGKAITVFLDKELLYERYQGADIEF